MIEDLKEERASDHTSRERERKEEEEEKDVEGDACNMTHVWTKKDRRGESGEKVII